ncbi:MAG TPA: gephyrin-like molybdotransferase Glp [Gemmataceae bacterium]|nr:gephyrin-like molybdotransferase Glp [Gemmataceae bacterium]
MANYSAGSPFFDVRMRGFPARTDVDEAVALIRKRVSSLGPESVPVDGAAGRVLAKAVTAEVPVPHFDRAAFDGFALRAADTAGAARDHPVPLRVVGEALPARPFGRAIGVGEAVRIMTGSPIPVGADAVLPAEHARESNGELTIAEPVGQWKNVGRVGEDVSLGRTVLPARRVLRPQDLGLLSSIGIAQVDVVRRPRVAILITGDEILPPGSKPTGFKIVDSNSVILRALIGRDGGEALPTNHLADRPDAIRAAMTADDRDVLLMSGGTSVGREDHTPRLVAELGELPIHGLALRPASPAGIGFIRNRPVFLLPGNPVACLCAYDLFAGRAVRLLGGRSDELPYRTVERPVAGRIESPVGRVEYARVTVGPDGVRPVPVTGASVLSSTVAADGFVLVPKERHGYAPGEVVTVHLYDD